LYEDFRSLLSKSNVTKINKNYRSKILKQQTEIILHHSILTFAVTR